MGGRVRHRDLDGRRVFGRFEGVYVLPCRSPVVNDCDAINERAGIGCPGAVSCRTGIHHGQGRAHRSDLGARIVDPEYFFEGRIERHRQ